MILEIIENEYPTPGTKFSSCCPDNITILLA